MGKAVRTAKAFIQGVVRGVGAPADTFIVNVYAYPHESELEAMRGDWKRVGASLSSSMKRIDAERIQQAA